MLKRIFAKSFLLTSIAACSFSAYSVQIVGTEKSTTIATKSMPGFAAQQEIPVTLMKIKLTQQEFNALKASRKNTQASFYSPRSDLPNQFELNFDNYEVLDQGQHGSCVTFATVGALNYLFGKSNYFSSLCSLSLGTTLEQNGYYPSGWNGSFGSIVLDQFMRFGVITMNQQSRNGCAGIKDYPLDNGDDTGNPMSLNAYKQLSQDVNASITKALFWSPLVTLHERFNFEDGVSTYNGEKTLQQVKESLAKSREDVKNIITMGFLLYSKPCRSGACGTYKKANDTWVISKEILDKFENDIAPNAGHEVIIYGYDDNAVVVDKQGKQHKGILKIRNSWGRNAGANGTYFMSYDYFIALADEVQKISRITVK